MLGCSSLTLSILAVCASMGRQQYMMTTLYCPSIQEHSSLFVSRQRKSSRTVHGISIKCRSSNTRCILLGSATPLQSQSGSKWKSFAMPYQILRRVKVDLRVFQNIQGLFFPTKSCMLPVGVSRLIRTFFG